MSISVNEPLLDGNELKYVTECIKTGWISSAGKFIDTFERGWADYCGMNYGIAVSNGTTALQIAVKCLDLKPGDEIIMPTFTIISCALAIIETGAVPVLIDSDPKTWCINVEKIEERISQRTKAIMVVHIYGHPVFMDKVLELAEKHNLVVIEDAAEVHGAEYFTHLNCDTPVWKRCGGIGHISTFSFYANKIITTGEGGMLLTNNIGYAEKARGLRNLCFRSERRFFHTEIGYNYRMTNMQAALGVAQLERIDKILAKKRWIGKTYTERLNRITSLQLPIEEPWARQVYWMYGVVLDENSGTDAILFAQRLKAQGVETRPFFLGMHEQPIFQKLGLFHDEHYPVAERIAKQGFYLPSGLTLTETHIDKICDVVDKLLK